MRGSYGHEIPLVTRAAILTLHLFTDKNFNEISTTLRVHPVAAQKLCDRVKDQAKINAGSDMRVSAEADTHEGPDSNSDSDPDSKIVEKQDEVLELFTLLEDLDRSGQPEAIPEGSE